MLFRGARWVRRPSSGPAAGQQRPSNPKCTGASERPSRPPCGHCGAAPRARVGIKLEMAPFSRFRVFAPRLLLLPPPSSLAANPTRPPREKRARPSCGGLVPPPGPPAKPCNGAASHVCCRPRLPGAPLSKAHQASKPAGQQASRPASKSFLGSWIWWSRPMAQLALFPGCPGARSHGRLSLGGAKTVGSCCIAGYLQLSCLDRPTARRSERCMPVSHITLAPALALALAHTVHTRAHRLNSHNSPCPGTMDSKQ